MVPHPTDIEGEEALAAEEATKLHYAYILRCADGTLYSGYTTNPQGRLAVHNRGRGSKYTRSRLPVELVYTECFATKGEALSREAALKRLPRHQKLLLIEQARKD